MLTRRTLLATSAAGLAAPAVIDTAHAATPKNIVVQAKAIDDIIGAFDPAESYEYTNNEVCGNMYRKLIVPDPPMRTSWWVISRRSGRSARTV